MAVSVYLFGLVIIFFETPVSTCPTCLKTKACDAVFNPDVLKVSCCTAMDDEFERIAGCQKNSCSDEFTCSVAQCAVDSYGITSNNTIDETKLRTLLRKFCKEDPSSRPYNNEVIKNCLNGKYNAYVTSDPNCDSMKYVVCAVTNYMMACQEFKTSPCSCKTLAENVKICKPFLQQYLKQINSSR